MSRIIVKQLPKNITEEKLRNLFGSKGTITDLQLKFTPDGKFRQFCFIGYHSEEEAEKAIQFFNNTCIQTSRIKVEKCETLGSEEKPQSWSKYAKDSKKNAVKPTENGTENKTEQKTEQQAKVKKLTKLNEIVGAHKDDPEFQEFMQAHDRNRALWGNDALLIENRNENSDDNEHDGGKDSGVAEDDDVEDNINSDEEEEEEDNDRQTKLAEQSISDLDYMKSLMSKNTTAADSKKETNKKISEKSKNIDLCTIKIHNLPYKTRRQDIIKFFKPLKPYSVRMPTNVSGFCYVGFKKDKEMEKAMLKNKSFIKGKQVFFSDFTEKNKVTKSRKNMQGNEANEQTMDKSGKLENAKWNKQKENIRNEEEICESGRIFFRNLAYSVTADDLEKLFGEFGPVAEVNLPVDTITRKIKGFGTVTFVMPEHAVLAFNKLDGTDFHGRLLHLIPAKSHDHEELQLTDENAATLSFKQKKALKLKQSADKVATWNTLFLGANAVANVLAQKYNTSKEHILDIDAGGSSAAVRLALGETQIVIEMRKFLESESVHLPAFDVPNAKRSKTIMLAKNLPSDTTAEELIPIFSKFGPIGRLVLPPSGVTALIEFCDPTEARKAFKKLAYSKFKNVPLFLEWAPENTFSTSLTGEPIANKLTTENEDNTAMQDNAEKAHSETAAAEIEQNTNTVEEEEEEDLADAEPEPSTTLFLRNLNFKTVLETVRDHFKHIGPIHTVEIAKRKDTDNPGTWSSMGYGFIQFKKTEHAARALRDMQFTNIDGNQVELKRSDRILKSSLNAPQRKGVTFTKQTGSKILVRNIPFQAKVKEVRELFKAFGELRSVRLPLKMAPGEESHRGFGFVDFISKSDAKKAFEALCQSTHLYGRRLVLEWASTDEEDIDALRKRTASHFNAANTASAQKRSRKSVFNTENMEGLPKTADENM